MPVCVATIREDLASYEAMYSDLESDSCKNRNILRGLTDKLDNLGKDHATEYAR